MLRKIFLAFVLIFTISKSFGDTTKAQVFSENGIHFGNESLYENDTVNVEDNGRVIARTLSLPEFEEPVKIEAHLEVKSYLDPELTNGDQGDPWDRSGTIYLSVPGMENIELLKFITGFGGHSNLKNDVSNLAPLLQGDAKINAFIDTWVSPGWHVDLELIYVPIDTVENPDWANGLYYDSGLSKGEVTDQNPGRDITIPDSHERMNLVYYTSGHSTEGSEFDEFHKRDNVIYIDGQEIYRYTPWRTDCENFATQNPYSGWWYEGSQKVYSYELSRSGWCPGDKVEPVILDVSEKLTTGEHRIRWAVEDIGENTAYWRVSSYLTGYGDITDWQPEKIEVTSSASGNMVIPGTIVSLRIDLVDQFGNLVPYSDNTVKIRSDSSSAKFSLDQNEWKDSLEINIQHGSALVWVKSDQEGEIPISVQEISTATPLDSPEDIIISYFKPDIEEKVNFALTATATADCECASSETAFHGIDGSLETKWCCNDGAPNWLKVELQDTTAIDYFVLYNAGAGQAPAGDPGSGDNSSMNTQSYKIQKLNNGEWKNLIVETDNPANEAGDISFHKLDQPVDIKTVRLYTDLPSTSRIYEFEIYNLDSTETSDLDNDPSDCILSPDDFELLSNYPNPFNSATQIKFFIPLYGKVSVAIFDSQGRKVKSLLNGKLRKGFHTLKWKGNNEKGNSLSSGVYFISVKYSNKVQNFQKQKIQTSTYLK